MATQTIKLYPISTVSDGGVSTTPSGGSIYSLINEEVPDDDVSYVHSNGVANVSFFVETQSFENVGKITDVILHLRLRYIAGKVGEDASFYPQLQYQDNTGTWTTYVFQSIDTVYDENKTYPYENTSLHVSTEVINKINLYKSNTNSFRIGGVYTKGSYGITQMYVELVYDDSINITPIYIRENNNWIESSGMLYKREDGVWKEIDTSFLEKRCYIIKRNT